MSRVTQSDSRVISIVAPAGFGKTAVAEIVGAQLGRVITCDAGLVAGLPDFAGRIVRALQREAPEREAALANDLFVHLQPTVSSAQLAGFVVEAWESIDLPTVVIFDDLESIAEQAESLDLLARLIKHAGRRRLILCSRAQLPLLNSRLIPPSEHLRIHIDDLAFTVDEIEEAFGGSVDRELVERVFEITQGWPVAVFLLRQLARLGKLERALDETAGSDLEDLQDYLLAEVMDTIPDHLRHVLLALVAAAGGSREAVERASGGIATSESLIELSRRFPLVRFSTAARCYRVHPLIVSLIESTEAARIEEMRLSTAASFERDGRFAVAARLYIDAGRFDAAAAWLERLIGPFVEHDTFAATSDLIDRMPASVISANPRLWAALAWIRRNIARPKILATEGKALRESRQFPFDSLEAKQVDAILLLFVTVLGDHDYAAQILAERPIVENPVEPGDVAFLTAVTMRDMLMGRARHAGERSRRLMPLLRNPLVRSSFLMRVDVGLATMAGRFDEALQGHARALEQAHTSTPAWMVGGLLPDRAFVAWIAGEEDTFERSFEEMLHSSGVVLAATEAAVPDAWFGSEGIAFARRLLPRSRAFMFLLLAGRAPRGERQRELLGLAREAAHVAQDIWVEVLILVALAMTDSGARKELLMEALGLTEEIGQPAVSVSVRSLLDGGTGAPTLAALARRFRRDPARERMSAPIRVNALSRSVWRGDAQVVLSNRAMSLVLALAVLKGMRREALAELLWGGEAADSAAQALKMLVMRARTQLGDPSLIVANNGGYELRSDVSTDFEEIERLLRSLAPHDPLSDLQRSVLRTSYDQFKSTWRLREPHGAIVSVEAVLASTRQRVIERLARDALDRGDIAFAFDLADQLKRYDGSDEVATEILIRAYIRSGNNASALREYRKYSDHLMRDLGIEPSFSIDDLFETTAE